MKIYNRIITLVLILFFAAPGCSKNEEPPTQSNDNIDQNGYQLVWSDEFNYSGKPDETKWDYDIGAGGWGNNELQYYTSDSVNVRVENGKLVIEAHQYPNAAVEYTSTRIVTRNKGDWKYGKIEVRAKLPFGKGLWPAIWMLPTDWEYGGWAASGEIDIMEYLGHETNKIHGTIHYGGSPPNNTQSGANFTLANSTFAADFHTFSIEWEETEIRWYIDGHLYSTKNSWYATSTNPFPAPFDKRFHLLINVAVGGNWPGYPDQSTQFPQRMEVDWVRVYQKN